MAINYTVQAEVVNINVDTPRAEDVFMVDTNVWYWLTYSKASQCARPPAYYQISKYPVTLIRRFALVREFFNPD